MPMQQPDADTAATQVLQTTELLEQILLHLPIHTLFTHQIISKQWQSTILGSPSLLENMFLSSISPPIKPVDTMYNTYANRTRCIYPPEPVRTNPAADVIGLINSQASAAPNGTLRALPSPPPPLATFGLSDQNIFLQFEIKGLPIYEGRILDENASWRKMLITQPGLVAVNLEFIRRCDPYEGSVTLYDPRGITFGHVHEWLVKSAREYWEMTGQNPELSFERVSFCLFHPWTEEQMEEAW